MTPTERELSLEERAELLQELAEARAMLPEDVDPADADAVVEAVSAILDEARRDPASVGGDLDEIGFSMGLLLAAAIVARVPGWSWTHLAYPSGFESLAIVAEDRAFLCFPFHFAYEIAADPKKENTVAKLWKVLGEGRLPPASAGALLALH